MPTRSMSVLILMPNDAAPSSPASPATTATTARTAPVLRLGIQPLVQGYERPSYVAFAPDDADTLYVVERGGLIYAQKHDEDERVELLDFSQSVGLEGEEGLHSMAFHPDFRNGSGRFYVYFNDRKGDIRVHEYSLETLAEDPRGELYAVSFSEGIIYRLVD